MTADHSPHPWQIGQRWGNNRTEVVDANGNGVLIVWTHEQTDPGKKPKDRDDYSPTAQGAANLAAAVVAPALLAFVRSLAPLDVDAIRREGRTVEVLRTLKAEALAAGGGL